MGTIFILQLERLWRILGCTHCRVWLLPPELNFQSQSEDPVNRNDLCHRIFRGTSRGYMKHRQFKKYFVTCNPAVPTPDPKVSSNWNIEKLVKQIMHISNQAMLIGK